MHKSCNMDKYFFLNPKKKCIFAPENYISMKKKPSLTTQIGIALLLAVLAGILLHDHAGFFFIDM